MPRNTKYLKNYRTHDNNNDNISNNYILSSFIFR